MAGVRIENLKWSLEKEVECFHGLDAGLMPLADSPWARGKCAYKILQYMACAIPAVASPVGANPGVIEDGVNGYLAGDSGDWVEKISRLIEDRVAAREMGRRGRKTVEQHYALPAVARRAAKLLGDFQLFLRNQYIEFRWPKLWPR